MFNLLLNKLERLKPLLQLVNNPELEAQAAFLAERLANPAAYILIMGETSSGKSSLINGLFSQNYCW